MVEFDVNDPIAETEFRHRTARDRIAALEAENRLLSDCVQDYKAETANLRAELEASQAALAEELEARKRDHDALATARNDAIEACAKWCDEKNGYLYAMRKIAAALRALKTKEG